MWHVDGVRIFKQQKAWVYSFSSATRKGPSLQTKFVFLVVRDNVTLKRETHYAIASHIAWCQRVLLTGNFPSSDADGNEWQGNTLRSCQAGLPFADGWCCQFAAFKGDMEARVAIHRLSRNWMSNWICEHDFAGKHNLLFTDFSDNATWWETTLTHEQFCMLNGPGYQSPWLQVGSPSTYSGFCRGTKP